MENKDKETIGLRPILIKYMRHWKLFLLVFFFSAVFAILYLIFYPKTYEFMENIQLQEDKESALGGLGLGEAAGLMKSFGLGGSSSGSISLDDETEILMSNRLLRKMILDLGLNISYSKPFSFYKLYNDNSPLILTADSSVFSNQLDEYKFVVNVYSQNKISVKAVSRQSGESLSFEYSSLPAKIKIDDNEFILDFNKDVAYNGGYKLKIRCIPASWVAEKMSKKIVVEDVSKSSNVLKLTYQDHSKKRGYDVLNTLIDEYNYDTKTFKNEEDTKTLDFINGRINTVISDLHNVESEIEVYKTTNNMTMIEYDVEMNGEEMKDLRKSIIEIETNARLVNMLNDYIKNPENKYNVIPSLFTAAEGEKSGAISDYNNAIIERDRLLRNSNEKNPMYITINEQVEKLREGVNTMISNSQKTYSITLNDLKAKENDLKLKMKSLPTKEREYVDYRRNQEILQGIYLLLLQKREETMLSLGKQTDRARRIEPVYAAKKAVAPRKLYALIGMIILTLFVSIGWIIGKEQYLLLKNDMRKKD